MFIKMQFMQSKLFEWFCARLGSEIYNYKDPFLSYAEIKRNFVKISNAYIFTVVETMRTIMRH